MQFTDAIWFHLSPYLTSYRFPLRQVCREWRGEEAVTIQEFAKAMFREGQLSLIGHYRLPLTALTAPELVKGGDPELLDRYRDLLVGEWSDVVWDVSIREGNMSMLDWAVVQNVPLPPHPVEKAVRAGRRSSIRWLQGYGFTLSRNVLFCAMYQVATATAEHRRTVQADSKEPQNSDSANAVLMTEAMVIWLMKRGCRGRKAFMEAAAGAGSIRLLQWGWDNKYPVTVTAAETAALRGFWQGLKWLRKHNVPFSSRVLQLAVRWPDIEGLEWLHREGCTFTDRITASAARYGRLANLQWLRSQGCPWNSRVLTSAIRGDHLETFIWAWEQGCPRDQVIGRIAASRGALPFIDWMWNQGEVWNPQWAVFAARQGHVPVLQWLHQKNYPGVTSEWDRRILLAAAGDGRLEVLQWAYDHGAPFFSEMVRRAARPRLPFPRSPFTPSLVVVQWLVERGCPWVAEEVQQAADEIKVWLWACAAATRQR
jgi:hypothetical protein